MNTLDINKIEELEEKIKQLESSNSFLTEKFISLLEKESQLLVLNTLASSIANKTTLKDIFEAIPENTFSALGFVDCAIFLHNETTNELEQKATFIFEQQVITDFKQHISVGIMGRVFREKKAVIINNCRESKDYTIYNAQAGSEICVPILAYNEVIGVIDAENAEQNCFEPRHIKLLESIASTLSAKLEEVKTKEDLEDKVKERTRKLEATIKELQKSNEEVTKQRNDKDILLKEVHHRVKNNLQIISSLISLQTSQIEDEHSIRLFNECKDRVLSMSLIHEQLYESRDISTIKLDKYLNELTGNLVSTYDYKDKVEIITKAENLSVDLNSLIPLGLILNELISNSLKYAFPQNSDFNCIEIKAVHIDETIFLTYYDNGIGFPNEVFENEDNATLGIILIHALIEQIDGKIEKVSLEKGTMFKIEFGI